MSKIIGILVLLGVVAFGAYSFVSWKNGSENVIMDKIKIPAGDNIIKLPGTETRDTTETGKENKEAAEVEEKVAPSKEKTVEAIESDSEVKDIEKDLDDLEGLDEELENL